MITFNPAPMNPSSASKQASSNKGASVTIAYEPSNPFATQTCRNGFSVNARTFTPSVPDTNASKYPVTMNSTFFPTIATNCTSEKPAARSEDSKSESKTATQKYKTE